MAVGIRADRQPDDLRSDSAGSQIETGRRRDYGDDLDSLSVGRLEHWDAIYRTRAPEDVSSPTVMPDGTAIVATFAPDGPEMCSGLPVRRYDASQLASECGPRFHLIASERYMHTTPRGVRQSFLHASFRRLSDDRELVST